MGWTTNLNWWSPDFWTINSGCRWPVASQPNQSLRHWFSRWIQWCRVRLPLFNRFLGWWWAMGVMVWYIKWVRKSGKYGRICLSHMFSHCVFLETEVAFLDKLILISLLLELQPCKPWGTKMVEGVAAEVVDLLQGSRRCPSWWLHRCRGGFSCCGSLDFPDGRILLVFVSVFVTAWDAWENLPEVS